MLTKTRFNRSEEFKYELRGNGPRELPEPVRCLYTLSIHANNRSVADAARAFKWVLGHNFLHVGLLIGDGLNRITLEIAEGLSEVAASKRAAELTGQYLVALFRELDGFKGSTEHGELQIFRASDILKESDFSSCYSDVETAFNTSTEFNHLVHLDAKNYVKRQARNNCLGLSFEAAVQRSTSYLMQEIAVYLLLAKRHWYLDAYMGTEIPVLLRLMENKFTQELPSSLNPLKYRLNLAIAKRTKAPIQGQRIGFEASTALGIDQSTQERRPVMATVRSHSL